MSYWSLPLHKVLEELKTSHKGLSEEEAQSRLSVYGPNELKREKQISPLKIFLRQFMNILIIVLLFASAIAYLIGDVTDAILIFAVILLNSIFGFILEYQAEEAIEALKRMSALKVTVLRSGKHLEIESSSVVPGDIIELLEGDKVSADCRIIESVNLQADESTLTGESTPVDKNSGEVPEQARVADRTNMLFSGTNIVRGHGRVVAVFTGMKTEVGKIATEIESPSPPTPLQIYLNKLGKTLGVLTLFVCVAVFLIGTATEKNLLSLFMTSVSLAAAAIPEGLPIIVTLALAFGVKKMARKKALVRTLPAVEALGSATVICTDKTGTLTENRMIVEKAYFDGRITSVKECKGSILFRAGLICNNSVLDKVDPTETALVDSARRAGIDEKEFFEYRRLAEIPFSSQTKSMTVFCMKGEEEFAFMKGAPSAVLAKCNRILEGNRVVKLTASKRAEIEEAVDNMAAGSLRVLGFAYKPESSKKLEEDMIFIGLQGMMDPPRREVRGAVRACQNAGINVVIITGDHPLTAKAVAESIGISVKNIMTGDELDKLSFEELRARVVNTTIFARVEPAQKNRIVKALRANGEVVAVTGDGVNDAPALKNADIGIAMGIRGTDVAKEAADMVITDDNFATIVAAIEEGRRVFDNIKKALIYLLSSNLGEVLIVFIASVMFLPLPLSAAQILWVNFLSDGFPALALGVDPAAPHIMRRKPSTSKGEVLNTNVILSIIRTGVLIAICCLLLYVVFLYSHGHAKAQTVVFTALVAAEFVILQTVRQNYGQKLFANKYITLSMIVVMVLQLALIYTPLSGIFHLVPLDLEDWIAIALTVGAIFVFNHLVHRFMKNE
jgi:Ca2+-transporting ATPase